jgi:hypothetical protein
MKRMNSVLQRVKQILAATAFFALSLQSFSLSAATITLMGTNVTYEYDDVTNAAALALFGTPTISGDVVSFLPPSFRAQSVDGVASSNPLVSTDVVSANFVFSRVWSRSQTALSSIEVIEFGDYEVSNGDSAHLDLLLTASSNANPLNFVPDLTSLDFVGDSGGAQTWLTSAEVNPMAAFSGTDSAWLWDFQVSIQNTLTATTNEVGETAWIQKKLTFAVTEVSEVPVPAALWLFSSALVGLVFYKRKYTAV